MDNSAARELLRSRLVLGKLKKPHSRAGEEAPHRVPRGRRRRTEYLARHTCSRQDRCHRRGRRPRLETARGGVDATALDWTPRVRSTRTAYPCGMGATQRLAVPAPAASSPSLSDDAQTLCAHTKRRGDDGRALRAFARRASGALYALACVALAAWTASFLWEASTADALASQPDSPVGRDDASPRRWLEAHAVALSGDDARRADARTADGRERSRFPPDADTRAKSVPHAPAPRAEPSALGQPPRTASASTWRARTYTHDAMRVVCKFCNGSGRDISILE